MAHQDYVVQMSPTSDLYMTNNAMSYAEATWGQVSLAYTFATLQEAQDRAATIGGGTVGTPR